MLIRVSGKGRRLRGPAVLCFALSVVTCGGGARFGPIDSPRSLPAKYPADAFIRLAKDAGAVRTSGAGRLLAANPLNYASIVPTLGPGDTLVLAPGNYADDGMPGLGLRGLNGTAEAPITIMGDLTRPRPVLLGRADVNTVRLANSSYIVLKHLEINNLNLGGDGVRAEGEAHHVTLEDLVINGVGPDQATAGISTSGGTTWNWIIRRCVIDGAGTGMYLGSSVGDRPFVAGLIENNLVVNSIGYNVQIKHQLARSYPRLPGMPTSPSVTTIRDNVFAKSGLNSSDGRRARPNLLVGSFPLRGPGSRDRYEIYRNFFFGNPTEALFQGEGNIALHHNLLVNPFRDGVNVRGHNGEVRDIQIFSNTVLAFGTGIRVVGGASGYSQRVVGNAVFARIPINAVSYASNVTDTFENASKYVANATPELGAMNLYPKRGMLRGEVIGSSNFSRFSDPGRDFNGRPYGPTCRGAYGGAGVNPGWQLQFEIKPEVQRHQADAYPDDCA